MRKLMNHQLFNNTLLLTGAPWAPKRGWLLASLSSLLKEQHRTPLIDIGS